MNRWQRRAARRNSRFVERIRQELRPFVGIWLWREIVRIPDDVLSELYEIEDLEGMCARVRPLLPQRFGTLMKNTLGADAWEDDRIKHFEPYADLSTDEVHKIAQGEHELSQVADAARIRAWVDAWMRGQMWVGDKLVETE